MRYALRGNRLDSAPTRSRVLSTATPRVVLTATISDVETPEALRSVEDVTAFVEQFKAQEEEARRKREEMELQLLRMRQKEALMRQAQLRSKGTSAAPAGSDNAPSPTQLHAFDLQEPGSPAASDLPASATFLSPQLTINTSSTSGPGSAAAPAARTKRKMMAKKSRHMQSIAAAAGLNKITVPPAPAAAVPASQPSSPGPLFREELILAQAESRTSGNASGSDDELCDMNVVPKPIFIVSDCTGESAARTVKAALNQFESRCGTRAPAQIMVFRFVEGADKLLTIVQEAAKEDALLVFTLVDPRMVGSLSAAAQHLGVKYVDLWSPLLDRMEDHLNTLRSGVPAALASMSGSARPRKATLSADYFRMIEAVEYTRKMDDGARPEEWQHADLLILGVSRCGKTPLSIYLGQRGYRVANLPLVPNTPIPRQLFEIDQNRIVGLTIDPQVLATIRRNRVSMMGVANAGAPIDYAEVAKIQNELRWARKLYEANPAWPVLDVTFRGIEETAARILKLLNDRSGHVSPQWVEEQHRKEAAAMASARAQAAVPLSNSHSLLMAMAGPAAAAAPATAAPAAPPAAAPAVAAPVPGPLAPEAGGGEPSLPGGVRPGAVPPGELMLHAGDSSYLMQGLY